MEEVRPVAADATPGGGSAAGCQEQRLVEKLAKSEQKRQRLRANLQKMRDKLIDTNKLLEIFNELKQEKELAERQVVSLSAAARELETVRRQQTEDRRKLEEARDQLVNKAREVKDLDAINARLRLKIDTSVAEGTQRVMRELERCKKDTQAAQQAKETAERRARQADSRLEAEEARVIELQEQLQVFRAAQPKSAPAAISTVADSAPTVNQALSAAQLNDMSGAISEHLRESLQQMVRIEVDKATRRPTFAQDSAKAPDQAVATNQFEALRTTLEERFQDLTTAVQTSARKRSVDKIEETTEVESDCGTTTELLREMRWIRRRLTQDDQPHMPNSAAASFPAIADADEPPSIHADSDSRTGRENQDDRVHIPRDGQIVASRQGEGHEKENTNHQQNGSQQEREKEQTDAQDCTQTGDFSSQKGARDISRQEEEQEEADAASFALELEEALSPDGDAGSEVRTLGDATAVSKRSHSTNTTEQRNKREVEPVGEHLNHAHMSQLEFDLSRSSQPEAHKLPATDGTGGASNTNKHMDRAEFESRLKRFYAPNKVPSPILCGVQIDLFMLYELVAEHGGPHQTGKLRKWAEVGRKLIRSSAGSSTADVPSNAGNNAKSNYSKYVRPAIEGRQDGRSVNQKRPAHVASEAEQQRSRKSARVMPALPGSTAVTLDTAFVANLWNTVATCSAPDSSKKLGEALSHFVCEQIQGCAPERDGRGTRCGVVSELMKLSGRMTAFRQGGNLEYGCDGGSAQACAQVEPCLVAAAGPALQALRSWCEAVVLATSTSDSLHASDQHTIESVAMVWCNAIVDLVNSLQGSRIDAECAASSLLPIEDMSSAVGCAFLALLCHLLDHVAAGLSAALLKYLHRRLLCFDLGKEEILARHFGYTFGFLCKQQGAMDTGRVCLYELLCHSTILQLGVVDAICAGWPELAPFKKTTGKIGSVGTKTDGDESSATNRSQWWLRHAMARALTCQCADLSIPDTGLDEVNPYSTHRNSKNLTQARHFWQRLRPTWDLPQATGDRTELKFWDDLLKAILESDLGLADDIAIDLHLSAGLASRMKDWTWLHEKWIAPTLIPLITQDSRQIEQGVLSDEHSAGNSSTTLPSSTRHQVNAIRLLGELAVGIAERSATGRLSTEERRRPLHPHSMRFTISKLRQPHTANLRSGFVKCSLTTLSSPDELVALIVGALAERVSASRSCGRVHRNDAGTMLSNGNGHSSAGSTAIMHQQHECTHTSSTNYRGGQVCQCGGCCGDTAACILATAATNALARIGAMSCEP